MKLSRDLSRGAVVTVHLTSGRTVRGRVLVWSRDLLTLVEHRIELDGVLHEATSKRLLVPLRLVELVEVVA